LKNYKKSREKMESDFIQFFKTLHPKKTYNRNELLELWREYKGVGIVLEGDEPRECKHFFKIKNTTCKNACISGSQYCETHYKRYENLLVLKRHPTLKMYWNPTSHIVFNDDQIAIGKTTKIDLGKKSIISPLEDADIEKCREIGYRYDDTVISKKSREEIKKEKAGKKKREISSDYIKAEDIKLLTEM